MRSLAWTIIRLLSLITPVLFLLTLVLLAMFTRNVSDSAAPVGWYRVHWDAPVRGGDLVMLRMPIKQVLAVAKEGTVEQLREEYRAAAKKLDKAAVRRIVHPNLAARKKSQLARLLHQKETAS